MTSRAIMYLEPDQLDALKKRARRERISVAALVRRIIRSYLTETQGVPPVGRDDYARIVGLGSSGKPDIGDNHDRRLGETLTRDHLR